FLAMQKERVKGPPGEVGPQRLGMGAQQIPRTDLLTFEKEGFAPRNVPSTSDDIIRTLKGEGYKQTGRYPISAAQMEQLGKQGKLARRIGPGWEAEAAKGSRFYEADLPQAYGARMAQHEQAMATKTFRDIIAPWGVELPRSQIGKQRFAHLAMPKIKPVPGGPFDDLVRMGVYKRAYPTQIADMIDNMTSVWQSEEAMSWLLRATDTTLGWWKTVQLYHPAYLIRNIFQNFFGGIMAGANPLAVAKFSISPQVKQLRTALMMGDPGTIRGMTMRLAGRDVPVESLFQTARQMHMTGAGYTAAQIPKSTQSAAGAMATRAMGVKKRLTTAVFRANSMIEDTQKLGTMLHFMDTGMDARSAAMKTLMAMPDLTDLTLWERNVAKRLFPFYSWMRRNGALQIFHYLPRQPGYANLMGKLGNFAEGFRGKDNVPAELRPMWMREQMGMQVAGGPEQGQAFLAQTWFPFEEAYQAMGLPVVPGEAARRAVSSLRPSLRGLYEMGTGMNVFRQEPYPEGTRMGTAGYVKAIPQAMAGRSRTPMDAFLGLRPVREWGPGGRVSEMPTAGGKVGRAILGGAMQPISRQKGLAAEYVRLRDLAGKLRSQINRAQQVNDEDLARSLTIQWMRVIRRMHELGMPGIAKTTGAMLTEAGIPQGPQAFEK
ncbi:MAG: hypothetical protein ABH877_00625, partial [bacterium]